jgi:hypothetical protein
MSLSFVRLDVNTMSRPSGEIAGSTSVAATAPDLDPMEKFSFGAVDGKYAFLSIQYGQASAFAFGRTYVLPLERGSVLPSMPTGGFRTEADVAAAPGVQILPYGDVGPGPSPATYAFSRVTAARNLYRIPLE